MPPEGHMPAKGRHDIPRFACHALAHPAPSTPGEACAARRVASRGAPMRHPPPAPGGARRGDSEDAVCSARRGSAHREDRRSPDASREGPRFGGALSRSQASHAPTWTPTQAAEFAKSARERGFGVVICAAGMAAHLCGVIASMTTVPVIGVPINSTLDGMDALLAIVQMPPGIPVATVGINGSLNAGILAVQMLAVGDDKLQEKLDQYKEDLKKKIIQANEDLAKVSYTYKTN